MYFKDYFRAEMTLIVEALLPLKYVRGGCSVRIIPSYKMRVIILTRDNSRGFFLLAG